MYDVELFDVVEVQGLTLVNVRERHVRLFLLCESPDSGTSDDSDTENYIRMFDFVSSAPQGCGPQH